MIKKLSLFWVLFLFSGIVGAGVNAVANPVDDFLNRIGGAGASDRFITAVEASGDGQDYFTIASEKGKPKITGNSYLSITTGIGWYLKYYANICLTWNNLTTDLTTVNLPLPQQAETHRTKMKCRYDLNYCTFSYSMSFWDWDRWQKEIDWMALHGVNMPLALTGTDVVWYDILVNSLGYTKTEANAFVAGSAYQAWFLMNNLEGWGGPNPDSWYVRQKSLQQNIVSRMRELGMMPVLPGYSGMVPHDIGTKKGWKITSSGTWCGFTRPEFIPTTEPQFNQMAQLYYDEMRNLYGASEYYSIDLFHEGSVPSGINVGNTYRDVYNAMVNYSGATNPQWVIQAWGSNPLQAGLDAVAPGKLIVLDLFSDGSGRWQNSFKQTNGTPNQFVFCMLNNFGGRTGLHGRLAKTINDFYAAKTQFPNTMMGVGATMEGLANNPMLYEALYELPWRAEKTGASEWIKIYPQFRYGKSNEATTKAWALLNNSVYNCNTSQQGTSESVLCARPSMTVNSVSTWSTSAIYWNPQDIRDAAALLLMQSNNLSGANYQYDAVDIVRQTLSDFSNELLKRIKSANDTKDVALRNARIDTFLTVILDQDRLLNTMPDFMVGKWIADARKMSDDVAEKNLYEKNARMLITTWGASANANGGGLHDYSNREWGGLMKDYYYPRWKTFFDKVKAGTTTPSATEFFNMEWAWATTNAATQPYPSTPQGDPVAVAREVFAKYFTLPDIITNDRTVSVMSANPQSGKAFILNLAGDTVYSVTGKDVVTINAIPATGYTFSGWTNEAGDTVSVKTSYTYTGSEPQIFTAHFDVLPGLSTYVMNNDLDVINFDPPLTVGEKWKMTAETRIFQHNASPNGAYNSWGSALFAEGTNPIADTYNTNGQSFQYYWAAGGGQLTLKNVTQFILRSSIAVNTTSGVLFHFEVVSDGNGKLQLTCYVDGEKIDDRTSGVNSTAIAYVSKASKYPVTVTVERESVTDIKKNIFSDSNDPVIRVQYYNLQGIEERYPVPFRLYIVKETHASRKIVVKKIINY